MAERIDPAQARAAFEMIRSQKAAAPQAQPDVPRDTTGRFARSAEQVAESSTANPTETTEQPRAPRQAQQATEPTEDQRVPYDRFEKVTHENKSLRGDKERLEKELTTLREQAEQARQDNLTKVILEEKKPTGWEDMTEDERIVYYADKLTRQRAPDLERLRKQMAKSEIAERLDISMRQAAVVAEVAEVAQGRLTDDECLLLAKARKPDLFDTAEATETRKVVNPSHVVQAPSRGTRSRAKVDSQDAETKILAEARGGRSTLVAAANYVRFKREQ